MNELSRWALSGALVVALSVALPARPAGAAQSDYDEEAWAPSRVGRLTVVTGDAAIRDAGTEEWARAEVNAPVFEGDEIFADRLGRVELSRGEGRFARFGDGADLV